MSHSFRGWSQANDGETIPYEVALVRFEQPTKDQLAQGAAIADELRDLAGDFPNESD